ncbi:slr1659 superfamily regulator [Beggiatoa leptomitoformis]|uniref:STAS domain-containing protein n=1 Tax=Beggiatoa leptomitoformis TaxID=288004 RepID=A0A2N9YFQ5_9GAMM|nr:hypothetical protein [Beggiatoa leptomitoformis]ALG68344.1 hypothetical protein AL038_12270 [Beggiatoa leptomitoformis]AUI69338.1 hypothetical protein BLE401_11995 [Beggiatoa leptomitoformis]
MNIETEDYKVMYDESLSTVTFQGFLQLNGMTEYAPITDLLNGIADKNPPHIKLDLRQLELLNSSGINMISKFVLKIRKIETINMSVLGSEDVEWQDKSLNNLKRLMPSLQLEWE